MPPLTREAYEDVSPFGALLPHGLLLDPEAGVVLLSTPRWGRPGLALGCAWAIAPRNIEVCEEAVCLDLARIHESLLRSLPVGAALQAIMTILPATAAPAWEQLRPVRGALPDGRRPARGAAGRPAASGRHDTAAASARSARP